MAAPDFSEKQPFSLQIALWNEDLQDLLIPIKVCLIAESIYAQNGAMIF